jgi:murein DD-endopeptidase MepM/ murein hydrolase activator NlpD
MAKVTHIEKYGNQFKIYYDDSSVALAIPTHGGIWLVTGTTGGGTIPPGSGTYSWPFLPSVIVSEFAWRPDRSEFHEGVDFSGAAAITGAKIYAVNAGTVEAINMSAAYGNSVQIGHGVDALNNGIHTIYAHMLNHPLVSPGNTVIKGQVIGYLDSSGTGITGPHLHWETHICPNNGSIVHNQSSPVDSPAVRSAINPRTFMASYGDGMVLPQ